MLDEKKIRELLMDAEISRLMAECWATRQEVRWLRDMADDLEWKFKEKERKVAEKHHLDFTDLFGLEILEQHEFAEWMKSKWKGEGK